MLDIDEIDISVYNGKVYLKGTVDSQFEKDEAEQTASLTAGVVEVQNLIVVQGEWAWKSDLDIKQDTEAELYWSPFVDSEDITVLVNEGTVTLTGTVDSWHERRVAVQNAIDGGARDVINHLEVKNYPDHLWTW
mgnify:FL=1